MMKKLVNRFGVINFCGLIGLSVFAVGVCSTAGANARSLKFSTGSTFDVFCIITGETDSTIRSLAKSGICLAMLESWGSRKATLAKTAQGSTVRWVAPYFNFGAMDGKSSRGFHDAQFYDNNIRNAHPEWVLRETTRTGCNGREIVLTSSPWQRIMDIGGRGSGPGLDSNKYVDRWMKEVLNSKASRSWDGVWADNVNRFNQGSFAALNNPSSCTSKSNCNVTGGVVPCNPRTRRAYTQSEWNTDLLHSLRRIQQVFNGSNLFFLAQTSGSLWRGYDTNAEQIADAIPILHIENFALNYGNRYLVFRDWVEQMRVVQDILDNRFATIVFRTPHNNGTSDAKFFRDASYLLVKEHNMMQRTLIGRGIGAIEFWWLNTDLGSPRGNMSVVPGTEVRQRNYANGKVLVNPHDTNSYRVSLGRAYTNVQTGGRVSSITLTPKRGAILTN